MERSSAGNICNGQTFGTLFPEDLRPRYYWAVLCVLAGLLEGLGDQCQVLGCLGEHIAAQGMPFVCG
eukprot:7226695-Pyramimonas_sp.AAC.1